MRRNYGSLNLAALDLHDASAGSSAVDGLEREFSALDPCAFECDSVDSSCSSEEFSRCVGYPMERLAIAPREESPEDAALSTATAPVPISPQYRPADPTQTQATIAATTRESSRRKRSISARGLDDDGDVRISNKLVATSEWPRQLHDQHHVELSALRCLGLKVMLSSLSTATSSSSSDDSPSTSGSSFGSFVGGGREKAAAILPLRRPSIPCNNMIQTV